MTQKIFLGAIGMCVVIVGALWWMQDRGGPRTGEDLRSQVQMLFRTHDASRAYEEFKSMYGDENITETHPAAHVFGEVLYEHEGIEGFSVCDAAFGFGCFHSFIGLAIAEHGIGAIQQFDEICIDSYGEAGLGCVHGIGHGVLAYYGYSNEALTTSLSACDALSWKHPYGGCRDGVFMEYNFRLMQGDAERVNRTFAHALRHAPCDSVSARDLSACYFAQPAWWEGALRGDSTAGHTMLSYCREVDAQDGKEACIRGIGYATAPQHHFDPDAGIAYCDALNGSERELVLCREGYAWALWSDPQYREMSDKVCTEGLKEASAQRCAAEYLFTIQ